MSSYGHRLKQVRQDQQESLQHQKCRLEHGRQMEI
jgi:hypothetical protein